MDTKRMAPGVRTEVVAVARAVVVAEVGVAEMAEAHALVQLDGSSETMDGVVAEDIATPMHHTCRNSTLDTRNSNILSILCIYHNRVEFRRLHTRCRMRFRCSLRFRCNMRSRCNMRFKCNMGSRCNQSPRKVLTALLVYRRKRLPPAVVERTLLLVRLRNCQKEDGGNWNTLFFCNSKFFLAQTNAKISSICTDGTNASAHFSLSLES